MQDKNGAKGGLLKGTAIVSSLTIVSRIFGFIRDLLVARLFGAGVYADCFFVAFRIPNLLRSFVAEGALTAAFVPVFSDQLRNGKEAAQKTISNVIGFLLTLTILLSVLGIIFAPEIVQLMAPGFERNPQAFALTTYLTQIMFPYVIFISLVAMLNGALNAVNVFGAAAFAQVVMNLVLIAGALVAVYFEDITAVKILAYSVVIGGMVQVLVQIPALKRGGFSMRVKFSLLDKCIRQLVLLMLPAIIGASVYQVSQIINTLFASLLDTGSVSWLFYADRLTQFPIGIFSIALASVLLPALANARAADDERSFSSGLENSLRFTSFVMLPVGFLLYLFAEPLISLIFERGAFQHSDTINTAAAVKAYAFGLWGISCHSMVSRAFIARKDTITPTLIGIVTLLVNVFLALVLTGPFNHMSQSRISSAVIGIQHSILEFLPSPNLRHSGLALASSISSTVAFFILCTLLSRVVPNMCWGALFSSLIRTALACVSATVVLYLVWPDISADLLISMIQIGTFAVLFLLAAALFGSQELRDCMVAMQRIFRRRK